MSDFRTAVDLGVRLWLFSYTFFLGITLLLKQEGKLKNVELKNCAYPFISFTAFLLIGIFSNKLVQAVNHWTMPTIGLRSSDACFLQAVNNVIYCPVGKETKLWFLADIFYIRPWGTVISVGDILLLSSGWISFMLIAWLTVRHIIVRNPSA